MGFPVSAGRTFSRATIAEMVAQPPFDIAVSRMEDGGYRMLDCLAHNIYASQSSKKFQENSRDCYWSGLFQDTLLPSLHGK